METLRITLRLVDHNSETPLLCLLCRTTSSLCLLFRISSTDHTDHAAVTKGCELAGLAWTLRSEDFVQNTTGFLTFFLSSTVAWLFNLNPGLFFNLNDQFSTWCKDDSIRSILISTSSEIFTTSRCLPSICSMGTEMSPLIQSEKHGPFPNRHITCHNTPVQRCHPTWAISSHRISVFWA